MAEYIMNIRGRIGNDPILICGADTIVINSANQVLMQKRLDNNLWAFPGGTVEIKENVEDTARRELLEETGLQAKELEFFHISSGGDDMMHTYPNGHVVSIVTIGFLCRNFSGTLQPDYIESSELRFFSLQDLPPMEEISPPARDMFQTLISANIL